MDGLQHDEASGYAAILLRSTYSCAKTKGNTLVHKECTRFKLDVHY